jgi:hypothetical protein
LIKETTEILHLETTAGNIDTTTNHPFYVIDKGWVAAGDLLVGDEVFGLDGGIFDITGFWLEMFDTPVVVYNLEVEGLHSYFVGEIGVLVHNTYETYTKTNKNGVVYSGRTKGNGSPTQNVNKRDRNHHMTKKGYGPAVLDKSSPNSSSIRGREQMLVDANGGAQSFGGSSGNAINGISPTNPNRMTYLNAAMKEFGLIP